MKRRPGRRAWPFVENIAGVPEVCLCELEARAIGHGDYILAGHLLKDSTLTWE